MSFQFSQPPGASAAEINADLSVPAIDSAANLLERDAIGHKADTVAGNSLVALARLLLANVAIIDGLHDVPLADSAVNAFIRDVLGNKLDVASDGVAASLVALVRESLDVLAEHDEHFHNLERWWGATGAPSETNAIAATVTVDFAATSGADDWGAAIPILGTADDPTPNSQLIFDAHRIIFTDLDADTSLWRFRIIFGYGTSAAAIGAGQWTEIPVITNAVPGNRSGGVASQVKIIRLPVGIKLWAQSWNQTGGEILSFQWGVHGYPAPTAPTPP